MSPLFAVIALAGGLAAQTPGAPATPAAKAEPAGGTLRDAYQREFAFLAAQKKELDERRVAQSKRAEAEAAAVRNEIARLEQQVLDLDTRLGALRDNATRAEDDARAVVDEALDERLRYGDTMGPAHQPPQEWREEPSGDSARSDGAGGRA